MDKLETNVQYPLLVTHRGSERVLYSFAVAKDQAGRPHAKLQSTLLPGTQVPQQYLPYVVSYGSASTVSKTPLHLKNILVINSTGAGTGHESSSSSLYFDVLGPLLKALGLMHVYVSTTSRDTIKSHALALDSNSTVILMSGDTSIHELVNSLAPTKGQLKLYVGVIPTGTGNALSLSLGHKDIALAVSRIFTGSAVPLFTSKVSFPRGSHYARSREPVSSLESLVVTSWGFHASLVADSDTPQYRKYGIERFQVSAKENLQREQSYHGTVSIANGPILSRSHSYLVFTLAQRFEPEFVISPRANLKTVYMVEFGTLPAADIMSIMGEVYQKGAHVKDPRVNYLPLESSVSVDIAEPDQRNLRWCVDGESVVVPGGQLRIDPATSDFNGWGLYVLR